jgi:copper resistance protein C
MNNRLDCRRTAWRLGVACAALLVTTSAAAAHGAGRRAEPVANDTPLVHLRLEKSEPAKGELLTASPTAIRLWFSLPPELAVTVVKLANAEGKAIPLGAPKRASGAKEPVVVDVSQPLAAGSYTVSWKTSSRDGHPIRGDFQFSIKGAAN